MPYLLSRLNISYRHIISLKPDAPIYENLWEREHTEDQGERIGFQVNGAETGYSLRKKKNPYPEASQHIQKLTPNKLRTRKKEYHHLKSREGFFFFN